MHCCCEHLELVYVRSGPLAGRPSHHECAAARHGVWAATNVAAGLWAGASPPPKYSGSRCWARAYAAQLAALSIDP
jgi:hypothetical protein